MGRAKIISGGENGLYTIERDFSLPGQAAELESLPPKKTALQGKIEAAQEDLDNKQLDVEAAVESLNRMIDDWQNEIAKGNDPDPPIDSEPDPLAINDPAYVLNAAADCLAAHNVLRTAAGLGSLSANAALQSAAQGHADWLANHNASGHTGANGSTPQQRMYAAGYPQGPGSGTGENQAAGHNSVAQVMAGWLASPGHKDNIYEGPFTQAGVGYAYRSLGMYKHYWVVNFGRPPN